MCVCIQVTGLKSGGAAAQSGRVQVGDTLLAVDGISCQGKLNLTKVGRVLVGDTLLAVDGMPEANPKP